MGKFKVDKSMEGRYCSILLEGISTVEAKIISVSEDEIVAEYGDGETIHMNTEKVIAFWPDKAKDLRRRKAKESRRKARDTPAVQMPQDST